jgi:hypothetical protein
VRTVPDILLVTLNCRYSHASLGLRYLYANMGALQPRCEIAEFVIGARTEWLAERILERAPRIVGFGVYIWNADETARLVAVLRRVAPEVTLVLGGPEVSHETGTQPILRDAHFVITGPGDVTFAKLCRQLLDGELPSAQVIAGEPVAPDALEPPYPFYSDDDLRHRILYVEASRGCPFRCEFCLSSLDRTAVPFDAGRFLAQMSRLYERGARRFKFVDRTFNLRTATSEAILRFFLERVEARPADPLHAHFELIPDHLPDRLRALIARFPPGALQFEIGIQTWNPQVQALISRRQDNAKAEANLAWLRAHTHAHLHVDLIAGLPGEDLASFAAGFDRLHALGPHEIQIGILKRLRGAPIARHAEAFALRFNPAPPYNVLSTDRLPFPAMQRIARFARHWDLVANSGRFRATLPTLLGLDAQPGDAQPGDVAAAPGARFERFMAFSEWLAARTGDSARLSAERLYEAVHEWLCDTGHCDRDRADALLAADYAASGLHGRPAFMRRGLRGSAGGSAALKRQARFADPAQVPGEAQSPDDAGRYFHRVV